MKTTPIGNVTAQLPIPARFPVCRDIIIDAERITEQSEGCLMTISALSFRAAFPGRVLSIQRKVIKAILSVRFLQSKGKRIYYLNTDVKP